MANETSYNSNTSLKPSNVKHNWTIEQVSEYIKCSNDPIYFMENYTKIVTLDNGLSLFKLYDCQKEKVKIIHENRKVILMEGRQQGKCHTKMTKYKVRNKITGETLYVRAEEFHQLCKN